MSVICDAQLVHSTLFTFVSFALNLVMNKTHNLTIYMLTYETADIKILNSINYH